MGDMDAQASRLDALRAIGWIVGSVCAASGLLGPFLAGGLDPTSLVGIASGSCGCVLGALVLDRQPANRAAWGFLAGGVLVVAFALLYSVTAGRVRAGDLSSEIGSLAAVTQIVGTLTGGALPLFQFLFPNGRLPSRRWRPVFALYLTGWIGGAVAVAIAIWPVRAPGIVADNGPVDIAVPAAAEPALQVIAATEAFAAVAMLAGVGAIAIRLRGARGEQRRQVLLALWGIGMTALLIAATAGLAAVGADTAESVTALCAPLPLLVAVTFAMRHLHLFDVDRLVGQTLTYGAVTVLLVVPYAVLTIWLGSLTGSLGGVPPSLTVAAATLAAAAAFRPLLRRIRAGVDRHFDRRTWLAVRAVEEFTRELRAGRVGPADLLEVLRRALGDPGARLGYLDGAAVIDVSGHPVNLGEIRPGRIRRTVTAGEVPLAVVDLDESLTAEAGLVDAVLAAAALPIENAAMHAHAAVHLAEVQASRSRIVAADDTNLRRIERDLHDGAQQRLVALALRLRMAQRDLPSSESRASDVLGAAVVELRATVGELRELTRGILPPVLTDEGLAVALRTATLRLPLRVTLDVTGERFPAAVEAAAWFIACEGMANAAKHAGCSLVGIHLHRDGEAVNLVVADDGAGGATITPGGGLQGLADRVAAIGGTFHVASPAAGGTRIEAVLPCAS